MNNRRNFIKNLSAASLTAAIPFTSASAVKSVNLDDSVKVGLIGVNSMGWADLKSFLKNDGTACIGL